MRWQLVLGLRKSYRENMTDLGAAILLSRVNKNVGFSCAFLNMC